MLEICVLQEVLFEETRLGPGAGVLRDPPGVCALLELLKPEVECICLAGFYHLFVSLALINWTVLWLQLLLNLQVIFTIEQDVPVDKYREVVI